MEYEILGAVEDGVTVGGAGGSEDGEGRFCWGAFLDRVVHPGPSFSSWESVGLADIVCAAQAGSGEMVERDESVGRSRCEEESGGVVERI